MCALTVVQNLLDVCQRAVDLEVDLEGLGEGRATLWSEIVGANSEAGQRAIDVQCLGDCLAALIPDVIISEFEALQRAVDFERLSDGHGALCADAIVVEPQQCQRVIIFERFGDRRTTFWTELVERKVKYPERAQESSQHGQNSRTIAT